MYFLATLHNRPPCRGEYDIHLYNSKKRTGSTKLMYAHAPEDFNYSYASKAITVGGPLGSVGWVDLWRGILICDLLRHGRHLRYIPLPSPFVPKVLKGVPTYVRDIIVVQGKIKFFYMHTYIKLWTRRLDATTMTVRNQRLDPNEQHQNWKDDGRVKITEVTVSDPTHVQILPNLQEGEDDTETILKRLCAGCPSLSLHQDGVVYITSKFVYHDDKAWVTAVDMRHKTLHDVAYYYSLEDA